MRTLVIAAIIASLAAPAFAEEDPSKAAGNMAEVAIARQMFQEILRLIAELRPQPPPALA